MRVHLVDALEARPTGGVSGVLLRHSYLYNLAWLSAQRIRIDRGTEDEPSSRRRLVLEPLKRISAAARERGIRVGLICFGEKPEAEQHNHGIPCPLPLAARWATENDIPLLEANPLFSGYDPEAIWMDHIHLNPLGHDVLSAAVAVWLLDVGLLAGHGEGD